ncbi:hypothetical protein [Thioclava sp. L04-15]|uniref:hypothetical protein n=2 Tax=Thioclava TaxID=285107 RepID=UPI0011BAC1C9|nr:hypothetical protein [Thioclava sp. L04-15]TNE87521.1 MAG: hypothetical protein EP337_10805 [Paracoccaceae bacterium]
MTGETEMRIVRYFLVGAVLAGLAACGDTTEQRAATGGVGGLVVAGPVGAVVGAGLGVVTKTN